VSASGSVWLRLRKYENPSGKADNGHCCDGKWGICQRSGCDYMFYVCLGYEERYSGKHYRHRWVCKGGRYTDTGTVVTWL